MTPQEMFDKAFSGVIAQGRGAFAIVGDRTFPECSYRTKDGDMCALGHVLKGIIPENSSIWSFKGGARGLLHQYEANTTNLDFLKNNILLANEIQDAHDNAAEYHGDDFINTYKSKMDGIAIRFGLKSVID